jgi:circadian clock protein KaiC
MSRVSKIQGKQSPTRPIDDASHAVAKSPTGITGLDEILYGGLPKDRPSLVYGGPGCGKTLLSMEFLCRGATQYNEPGVFIAFEEQTKDLSANVASIGFDLNELQKKNLIAVDSVRLDNTDPRQSGAFNLEGLFIRIGTLVEKIGAKRIAFDTLEVLLESIHDPSVARSELRRLFDWLRERDLTAIVTAEASGPGGSTRYGIEEFVSDCVIMLDNRTVDERATRRLRVLKYRGSVHRSDEYPFTISAMGIKVFPIFTMKLEQKASAQRVSSGVERLDATLSGGYYRGSSVLISGPAGTGKTTFAFHFVRAACERDEKTLYVSYEESASQMARNMKSVGIDVKKWLDSGCLKIESLRPTEFGLEGHLLWLQQIVDEYQPQNVVIDPMTSFLRMGSLMQTAAMLMREVDFLKSRGITAIFVALTRGGAEEQSDVEVSSLVDTWLLARTIESNGERNRTLFIVKSRGSAHSNQLAEFLITNKGIELLEPYIGPEGVLTGSAREVREQADRAAIEERKAALLRERARLERRKADIEDQIASLWRGFEEEREVLEESLAVESDLLEQSTRLRNLMKRSRWASDDATKKSTGPPHG